MFLVELDVDNGADYLYDLTNIFWHLVFGSFLREFYCAFAPPTISVIS